MTGLGLIGFSLVLIAGSGIRTDWVHHPIAATSSIAGSSAAEEPSDLVEVGTRAGSAAGSNSGNDGVTGGAGTCGSQRDCSCGGSGPPCTRLSDEPLGMDLAVAEAEKDAADVVRILPLASCVVVFWMIYSQVRPFFTPLHNLVSFLSPSPALCFARLQAAPMTTPAPKARHWNTSTTGIPMPRVRYPIYR